MTNIITAIAAVVITFLFNIIVGKITGNDKRVKDSAVCAMSMAGIFAFVVSFVSHKEPKTATIVLLSCVAVIGPVLILAVVYRMLDQQQSELSQGESSMGQKEYEKMSKALKEDYQHQLDEYGRGFQEQKGALEEQIAVLEKQIAGLETSYKEKIWQYEEKILQINSESESRIQSLSAKIAVYEEKETLRRKEEIRLRKHEKLQEQMKYHNVFEKAEYLRERGKISLAISLYEQALEIVNDVSQKEILKKALADCYLDAGEPGKAKKLLAEE